MSITELYSLRPRVLWQAFKSENFAFWMACAYLFFEYVRPQSIWPILNFYPYWGRTFVVLALLGWLVSANKQFVWTSATTGVFFLLFIITLSSYTAYWPQVSWQHFMDYFSWVIVFFVLTQTITTRQQFFILLLIFMLASFKLSQFGAISWAASGFSYRSWGIRGPEGFFENPGELAIQMLVFAPIALFFIQGIKEHIKPWLVKFLYLMPITAVFTIMGTNTRGGQLALAVQVLALIMMTKHRFKVIFAVTMITVAGYQFLPEEQKLRFEYSGKDVTSVQRLLYWEHGWTMMKEHPLLGVGYFNFIPYYERHHSEDIIGWRGRAELPHNIFIQVGTDTGFSGLAVFSLLIVGCYIGTRRIMQTAEANNDVFISNMAKGMNVALIGYVVAGQFVTVAYYPFFWVHITLVTIMATIIRNEVGDVEAINKEAVKNVGSAFNYGLANLSEKKT
ncbi:MAG: O-antigen ligase family protein [Gammaproteobacteria bacterium]|nr:O-antigen ligase family protein [Gammaproteobacteria bacterium]